MRCPKVPRKLGALVLCLVFATVVTWTTQPDKLTAYGLIVVGLYSAFAGTHAASDIAATKAIAPKAKPLEDEGS